MGLNPGGHEWDVGEERNPPGDPEGDADGPGANGELAVGALDAEVELVVGLADDIRDQRIAPKRGRASLSRTDVPRPKSAR